MKAEIFSRHSKLPRVLSVMMGNRYTGANRKEYPNLALKGADRTGLLTPII